jgi:anthranilate synthase component 2
MPQVHHGVARDMLIINQSKLFNSMPKRLKSGRYHSWAVEHASFPDELDILACDEELNTIMAFEHKQFHITGIQFHPESVLTEYGLKMIENWIHS